MFLQKNGKNITYVLFTFGILLILTGIFIDFSWLKAIGDSYSADGDCSVCEILDSSFMILLFSGSAVIIFTMRYCNNLFNRTLDLHEILELAVFLIIVPYVMSSQMRYLTNDEYEHLHNAWLRTEGTIPFFSIYTTHTPFLEWISAFFMQISGESTAIIQTMRLFICATSCASLWLIYIITKELFQSKTHALLAILLIISNLVWIDRSLEIRPDNIMLFFVLFSFWILLKYYKNPKGQYFFVFGLCAILAMLGKQNAAIFYLSIGLVLGCDVVLRKSLLNKKIIIIGVISVIILIFIEITSSFFVINIKRHLIPNSKKFFPLEFLMHIWRFNPAILLLFIFQLFSSLKLDERYKPFIKYIYSISFTCFVFLFLMNRPFMQEMLVMVIFMGILGSNILLKMMQKLNRELGAILIAIIIAPAFLYISHNVLYKQFTDDLETTKTILKIAESDDLVFDTYGKAIFRHHPLDPKYLIYSPNKFSRLDEIKKSNLKFLIKDSYYYPRLPNETLEWFNQNFRQTNENPNIFVRIGNTTHELW